MQKEENTSSGELTFVDAIQQGLRDVDEGRVVPIEEAKKRLGLM